MKYDFEKKVYSSLRAIDYLHQETALKTNLPDFPLDKCLATSKKNQDDGFQIKFLFDKPAGEPYARNMDDYGVKQKIIFRNDDKVYCINKDSTTRITRTMSMPSMITIRTNNFQKGLNEDFNGNKLRLIIPCKQEQEFGAFNSRSLHISGRTTFHGLLEVCVKKKYYHIFKHRNDDSNKNYLMIDALEPNEFEEFKNNTNAIILGYGFITGNLLRDEYYYYVDNTENNTKGDFIAYVKKDESIITNASLFNPFEFRQYLQHLKQEHVLDKIDLHLTREAFSKIVQRIADNDTFARCITLLISGNQSRILLLRSGIYSIALETLTNIIYEENQEKINPIPDKNLASTIQEKFRDVIESHKEELSDYGVQILNAKINDLNKPTNSKKLIKPFELCGIKLSKKEIEILNHRNKFLHGSAPFDEKQLQEKNSDLKYISSKLLSLVTILALKYCGYKGHVTDFGSLHQFQWEEKVTEHLFKII